MSKFNLKKLKQKEAFKKKADVKNKHGNKKLASSFNKKKGGCGCGRKTNKLR